MREKTKIRKKTAVFVMGKQNSSEKNGKSEASDT